MSEVLFGQFNCDEENFDNKGVVTYKYGDISKVVELLPIVVKVLELAIYNLGGMNTIQDRYGEYTERFRVRREVDIPDIIQRNNKIRVRDGLNPMTKKEADDFINELYDGHTSPVSEDEFTSQLIASDIHNNPSIHDPVYSAFKQLKDENYDLYEMVAEIFYHYFGDLALKVIVPMYKNIGIRQPKEN
jgi:transcriptional accessory protein Tex/SPT6